MLTVVAAHVIDTIATIVEPIGTASAVLTTQLPDLQLAPSGRPVHTQSPDHIVVSGTTHSGALISVTALWGKAADARTTVEIDGTRGTLRLRTALPLQLDAIEAWLASDGQAELSSLPSPATPSWARGLSPAALNVALAWRAFGQHTAGAVPFADADDALRLHRFLDHLSGTTGTRTPLM
jgi:predicted dehydrogenase